MRFPTFVPMALSAVVSLSGCQQQPNPPIATTSQDPKSVPTASPDAAESPDDLVKSELAKLEGDWTRVSLEIDGEKQASPEGHSLTIRGDQWIEKNPTSETPATVKIDPSKSPKQFEETSSEANALGEKSVVRGIYELDGDNLKTCLPFPFGEDLTKLKKVPTEFVTSPGSDFVITVYERKKP